jgi:hypothetical protein
MEELVLIAFWGHSIVGKGNHSVNHIQKIKPRVEQVCQELGLQYATEENAGRMYINLQGGPATMPPQNAYTPGAQHGGFHNQPQQQQGGYQNQPQSQQGGYQQGGYGGQQQQQQGYEQNNGQNQNNDQNDELEKLARKFLPRILKKLDGCCTVM